MKNIILFFKNNIIILISILLGVLAGYVYWFNWGIYYGTLPLSSECWVNCTYGGLLGGVAGSLVSR